jgi:hypothetical protein
MQAAEWGTSDAKLHFVTIQIILLFGDLNIFKIVGS